VEVASNEAAGNPGKNNDPSLPRGTEAGIIHVSFCKVASLSRACLSYNLKKVHY